MVRFFYRQVDYCKTPQTRYFIALMSCSKRLKYDLRFFYDRWDTKSHHCPFRELLDHLLPVGFVLLLYTLKKFATKCLALFCSAVAISIYYWKPSKRQETSIWPESLRFLHLLSSMNRVSVQKDAAGDRFCTSTVYEAAAVAQSYLEWSNLPLRHAAHFLRNNSFLANPGRKFRPEFTVNGVIWRNLIRARSPFGQQHVKRAPSESHSHSLFVIHFAPSHLMNTNSDGADRAHK